MRNTEGRVSFKFSHLFIALYCSVWKAFPWRYKNPNAPIPMYHSPTFLRWIQLLERFCSYKLIYDETSGGGKSHWRWITLVAINKNFLNNLDRVGFFAGSVWDQRISFTAGSAAGYCSDDQQQCTAAIQFAVNVSSTKYKPGIGRCSFLVYIRDGTTSVPGSR